tara:strand:+ start:168 stop:617 length:450 start_codon:yes stop_codon:yes gene_type:complete
MNKGDIKNWKLEEVINDIAIIDDVSQDYTKRILDKLKIPTTNHTSTNREFTEIDWKKIGSYHKFFFDNEKEEELNKEAFRNSVLSKKENIIITYGWNEPPIKISTQKFIEDWEDFIASTQWETIIFSEDLELIMEVSRDYNLHSNFKIR